MQRNNFLKQGVQYRPFICPTIKPLATFYAKTGGWETITASKKQFMNLNPIKILPNNLYKNNTHFINLLQFYNE